MAMKKFLCVVDVMPSGQITGIEVEAADAISAERLAGRIGCARYGNVEVLEVLRTDAVSAA